jgi:hypothetical protein
MSETAPLNTQLIDTLTQIIFALTDEERQILIHKLISCYAPNLRVKFSLLLVGWASCPPLYLI